MERSAPLKKDLLGGYHSADCVQGDLSAFGKRKWRDYWQSQHALPANIGGMHVHVNRKKLRQFEKFLASLPLCLPSEGYTAAKEQSNERTLFQSLLQASSEEASALISNLVTEMQQQLTEAPDCDDDSIWNDIEQYPTSTSERGRSGSSLRSSVPGSPGGATGISIECPGNDQDDESESY